MSVFSFTLDELGLRLEIQQVHAIVSPVHAVANFVCKLFPTIATQVGLPVSLPQIQPNFKLIYGK